VGVGVARVRISKRTVDSIVPSEKAFVLYDTELTGFGVRVMPSGSKSWIVEYRPGSGGRGVRSVRLSLGSTTLLTPDEARRLARDKLADARRGEDPATKRANERGTPTLATVIEAYLKDVKATKSPATHDLYRIYLELHVKPELGSKKLNSITRAAITNLHRVIGEDRRPTANRVIATLSGLFTFAAKSGLSVEGFNPAKGIDKFKEKGRERFLTTPELQRLGAVLREAETIGVEWQTDQTKPTAKHAPSAEKRRVVLPPAVTGAIRLLLFTGCRLREILNLRWRDIDLERGLLFLPKSKSGRKTIVLNAPALAVLSTLQREGSYVIPSMDPERPRRDLKKPWATIVRQADLAGLRIHDLRHSFASVGAGGGMGLPIIGKLLGHSQPSTTARYAHLDADPLRKASDRIGSSIAAALESNPAAEVFSLRKTAPAHSLPAPIL
jgi:integrase